MSEPEHAASDLPLLAQRLGVLDVAGRQQELFAFGVVLRVPPQLRFQFLRLLGGESAFAGGLFGLHGAFEAIFGQLCRLDMRGYAPWSRDPVLVVLERLATLWSGSRNQRGGDQRRRCEGRLVPKCELPKPIGCGRGAGDHRLIVQVTLDICGEPVSRFVSPPSILLERLHHDPVQFAANQGAELLRLDPAIGRHRRQRLTGAQTVLGLGGSSSRMIRIISSIAADRSRSLSNGVIPVSSSYSNTPNE